MDLKSPILKNRKWIALLLCVGAVFMLTIAVLAMSQYDGGPNVDVPSTSFVPTVPTTVPDLTPTQPPVDSEPETGAVGPMLQQGVAQKPEPTLLELNTLKRKDFKKVNGYITCKTEEYWLGIDVSLWQEDIDWEKVAASGVKFVMVRLAYRGWSKAGELHIDPRGEENLQGAMAAGLKVGVYIYSQATNVKEAVEEAQFLIELLDGRQLDMPVVFDWETPKETSARSWRVKPKTIHACALAFCKEIQEAGYQPMVYFNQSQGKYVYKLEELRAAGIELWLAMYTKAMTYEYRVQMWQYTGKGRVPGIKTPVDIDIYFPNY